jgi:formate dehydrogenase assembly factor FdhD
LRLGRFHLLYCRGHGPASPSPRAPLTRAVEVVNAHGETETISIPAERALTVYVDKRELVTLMTLGAHPEWLVLGYLRNQRLVRSVGAIESVTVDWDVARRGQYARGHRRHRGAHRQAAWSPPAAARAACSAG